ncbi:MAG: hypothetical protein A2Y64_05450 [Candidatus Coatesbacteria bacterium RBG_13_66_14]|uniref:Flagellar assembly protein T C-terminal domain-containing protein n=1 Tax=Candidatus Coatesbacteria bacterium RBG_13_66_14 TaxID=1817816 RepID=A0A1F5F7F5_9BACT|nr:MAG: hypothetical protein A2Y64_05450 [Candidatus Coatesbacteria bacterium RBG_13_66_14]
MRRGAPTRRFYGTFALLGLAGCLFTQTATAPKIDRLLVVDLRPGLEVTEEQARGLEEMLAQRLGELPGIVPWTRRDLVVELGGTVALGTEYREPGSLARPVLTIPAGLRELGVQIYLIGEVHTFGLSESFGEVGFRRDEAEVSLAVRLYLAPTGEFIAEAQTERLLAQSNTNRWRPGMVIGPNEEFLDTLEGRASQGAVDELAEDLAPDFEKTPWSGRVTEVEGDKVILPVGFEENAAPGDIFIIYGPSTVLGERGSRIGSVRIQSVGPGESLAEPISGGGFQSGQLAVQEL